MFLKLPLELENDINLSGNLKHYPERVLRYLNLKIPAN